MGLDTPITDRYNALELAEMFGGKWGRIVKRGAYVLDRDDRSVSAYENGYSISLEQIARLVKGLMRGLLGYAQDHRRLANAHGHDARVIEQLNGSSFRFSGSRFSWGFGFLLDFGRVHRVSSTWLISSRQALMSPICSSHKTETAISVPRNVGVDDYTKTSSQHAAESELEIVFVSWETPDDNDDLTNSR